MILRFFILIVSVLFTVSCESSLCDSRRTIYITSIYGVVHKKLNIIEGGRPVDYLVIKNNNDSLYYIDGVQGDLAYERMQEGRFYN